MTTDPPSGPAIAAVILRRLEARFGAPVSIAAPPEAVTGGYDTTIYFVTFAGPSLPPEWQAPLVLRVHPSPDRAAMARGEAVTQDFCARAGFPAPKVLDVVDPDDGAGLPVQVMERVPGKTMLALLTGRPWEFRKRSTELGRLHARLHSVTLEGWPHPEQATASPPALPYRRLALARRVATQGRPDGSAMQAALARVEPLVDRLSGSPPVLCHGDFHPLNVLVDGESATVIDWTDSCIGDRHGDVARLLCLLREVRIANPAAAGRVLLRAVTPQLARMYLRGYATVAPQPLDDERLAMWEPIHLLHDWARSLLTIELPNSETLINPAVVPWIRARLDHVLGRLVP